MNLLSPQQKEKIAREKRWKSVFVFLFFVFVFFAASSASLYFIYDFGVELLKTEKEIIKAEKEKIPDFMEKEEMVEEFNAIASRLDSFYGNLTDISGVLEEIHKTLPEESSINSFRLENNRVVLHGQASDWYSLNETEESFRENFSEVDFSPENWTETENINFLLSFKVE